MSEGNEDNLAQKMSTLEIDSRKKSVNRLPVGEDSYLIEKVIGSGSFGVVYRAKCERTSSVVAIKKVLQDKRYKNRELQIIKNLNHCNIVELKNSFYTEEGEKVFLHLVLEYVPETLYKICRTSSKKKIKIPLIQCKLYIYQMCRSLAYLHSKGVCHRDIKPQNLLIDSNLGVLKLCDFGSAKVLVKNEPNISYICSRYYRAPELIFGASNYSTSIDIWSTGCVLGELLIGKPLFQGDSTLDQLVEIVKILGTPTQEQVHAMNQNYLEFRFPYIPPLTWTQVLGANCPPEAADLLSKILVFKPGDRLKSIEICAHPFFDELRENPNGKLENGVSFPPLFNFTPEELSYISPDILQKLQPKYPTPSV